MWFPEMLYTIDILFVAFVLFFIFRGALHGFSGEMAHVVTLLAVLIGVFFYYPQWMQFAKDYCPSLSEATLRVLVPVVLALAAIFVFVVARVLFKQLFKSKLDGTADRIAGGLIGALRGILFGLAIFASLSLIPNETLYRVLSEKSSIGAWVCNTLTPWAQSRAQDLPVLKDKMSESLDDVIR